MEEVSVDLEFLDKRLKGFRFDKNDFNPGADPELAELLPPLSLLS